MPHQMKRFVFIGMIRLLKYCHIIDAALMKILIFVHIHRVNLDSDVFKIFLRNFHCFPDVLHIRICAALPCQDQNLFHACSGNDLHFMLDLFKRQLFPPDIVVTVESAVNTVILAIICDIQRCKDIDRISEMILGNLLRFPCHLLQVRRSSRR